MLLLQDKRSQCHCRPEQPAPFQQPGLPTGHLCNHAVKRGPVSRFNRTQPNSTVFNHNIWEAAIHHHTHPRNALAAAHVSSPARERGQQTSKTPPVWTLLQPVVDGASRIPPLPSGQSARTPAETSPHTPLQNPTITALRGSPQMLTTLPKCHSIQIVRRHRNHVGHQLDPSKTLVPYRARPTTPSFPLSAT